MTTWKTTNQIHEALEDKGLGVSIRAIQNRLKVGIQSEDSAMVRNTARNAKVKEYHPDLVERLFPGLGDEPEVLQGAIEVVEETKTLGWSNTASQITSYKSQIDFAALDKAEQYLDMEIEIIQGDIEEQEEAQALYEERLRVLAQKAAKRQELKEALLRKQAEDSAVNRILGMQAPKL